MEVFLRYCSSLLLLGAVACSSEPEQEFCVDDNVCGSGQICYGGVCLEPARLDCVEGEPLTPRAEITPRNLNFSEVDTFSRTLGVDVRNVGGCSLIVARAVIRDGVVFSCENCGASVLPATILPNRKLRFLINVDPSIPGSHEDVLTLDTSDPGLRTIDIALSVVSGGTPELSISPTALDFGFVPAGSTKTLAVQALNISEGSAVLDVERIQIDPPNAPVTVTPERPIPLSLNPVDQDATARLALNVTFAPTMTAALDAKLTLFVRAANPFTVDLRSTDQAPVLSANPASIDFGNVPVGTRVERGITLQNTGPSIWEGSRNFQSGSSPDLSLPQILPDLDPGELFELVVVYEATRPGAVSDAVRIVGNDPTRPAIVIPVSGSAQASAQQTIAVQMSFDNSSSSRFDLDLRDVDLILENPNGQVVREDSPLGIWGVYGNARFSSTPPENNPERVVLSGATMDGSYALSLNYIEDCATLPSALTGLILGVSAEAVVEQLSEGDVTIDGSELASAVEEACADRRGTNVMLTVTVDGTPVHSQNVNLSAKGDLQVPFSLVSTGGRFAVVP